MRMRRTVIPLVLAVVACAAVLASPSAAVAKDRAYVFFSQYCESCREKAPLLRDWERRNSRRYQLVGVGFRESDREARRFARELGLRMGARGDRSGRLARRLGVDVPTIIAIVRDGRVIRRLDYERWKG